MKIGIAGPMTLKLLVGDLTESGGLPSGYDSPAISFLIKALLKRGHQIVAYTCSTGIPEPLVYQGKSLTICIGRRREQHAARDLFKTEREDLVRFMRSYSTDIVNAHWSYEFSWAALDSGRPCLVTVRDNAQRVFKYARDPYRLVRLYMSYLVLRKAKFLSTNSKYLFDSLSSDKRRKARITPNFYSDELGGSTLDHQGKSDFVLTVVNGFSKWKNVSTGLQAFALIRKALPGIQYYLVGEGMEVGGPAYRYAAKHRVSDGVEFIGPVSHSEVVKIMGEALVLLHPSREESFGMTILEAMVAGTPVVAGHDSGNVPNLLDKGRCGILCNVRSAKDIASHVTKLLREVDLMTSMIQNARSFAKENFSEAVAIPAYTEYYEQIISS